MSFGQYSRLPDRRVLGELHGSQHRPSLVTPPKLKVSAHSDPMKHWNFRKAGRKRFCLLTDEFVERLPPLDTSNIERAYQDFARATARRWRPNNLFPRSNNISQVKQCIPRGCRKNYSMCHAGTKSARPSIAPLPEPQWGLTLIEPLRPYYLGSGRRSRIDGRNQ